MKDRMIFPTQQTGEFTVTALSDGYLSVSPDLLTNIQPEEVVGRQMNAGISDPSAVHINSYLVRGRGRTLLIDAGAGGFKQWGGELQANMVRAGVLPSEVDTILLTHAHPDHIGGLLDSSGNRLFPEAELVINERELSFWLDDSHLNRAPERVRGNFMFARRVFDQYQPNLRCFTQGEVLPGISAVPLPGHTAGHTGYCLESADDALLVWGDIVHFPDIQITRPEVSIAFDQDPLRAADTRRALLDRVSADRLLVAGMHFDDYGFARIRKSGSGFRREEDF